MSYAVHPVEATDPPERVGRLVEQVRAGGVFVLTGAGLSTDSGIPDYRGRDGVRRVMPMQYAEFAGSSAARRRYWARSFVGWQRFREAAPNDGHRSVARLQQLGVVEELVTQNVDGLHQRAGSPDVIELHGSLAQVVCLTCGDRSARPHVQERLAEANPGFTDHVRGAARDGSQVSSQIRPDGDIVLADEVVETFRAPTCLVCGVDTLKPDVVFFGESVPRERVQRCLDAVDASRSVLVLGSSLAVMSGYRFVRRAAARGIPVAIVTRGATRGDGEATLHLDAPLAPTLSALVDALR
ncbi:MAG: NAD-dependent protein deacetylase [Candidatus Phosphoribacter baldrii]